LDQGNGVVTARSNITLGDLIKRYRDTVSPKKKGCAKETSRLNKLLTYSIVHTPDEVAAMGTRDVDTVAGVLGHQEFMLGDRPSGVDATAYAFLAAILAVPIESAVRAHLQTSETLTAYCARLKERCYPD
jgi:hypothetical protein